MSRLRVFVWLLAQRSQAVGVRTPIGFYQFLNVAFETISRLQAMVNVVLVNLAEERCLMYESLQSRVLVAGVGDIFQFLALEDVVCRSCQPICIHLSSLSNH